MIRILVKVLKWFGLGLFWLLLLITPPNLGLRDGCTTWEAILALLPLDNEFGVECSLRIKVGTPFLSVANDGAVSSGWSLFETSWHVAMWLACVVGSHFAWKKLRDRFTSLKEVRQKAWQFPFTWRPLWVRSRGLEGIEKVQVVERFR